MNALRGRDPSRGEARQHHDQSAEDGADRRDEGEQSGLDAEDERTLDADDRKADPGDEKHRGHGDDLGDQPALQRLADAVDDRRWRAPRCLAGAMNSSPLR